MSKLFLLIKKELNLVDECLNQQAYNAISIIPDLAHYLIARGGKRLRPTLLLASSYLYQDILPKSAIFLAATIEFIHSATLLHDDVIDSAHLRRGVKPAHHIWGNRATILVGDFLIAQALKNIARYGNNQILNILSDVAITLTEGEILQLQHIHNVTLSRETYLNIIKDKTASLFSASCQIGAMISCAPKKDIKILKQYGEHLGMMFQIVDDILDYTQTKDTTGKIQGNDLLEGKMTLPLIIAYEEGYHELVKNSLREPKIFWEELQNTFLNINVFQKSYSIACTHLIQAEQALESLSVNKKNIWYQALKEMTKESIARIA